MALNSDQHRNLKFAANQVNFSFARDTTAVLLAGVEFAEAGREYPIVFVRGQDKSGALSLGYLHLASLGNMRKLLDRLSAHPAAKKQGKSAANPPLH